MKKSISSNSVNKSIQIVNLSGKYVFPEDSDENGLIQQIQFKKDNSILSCIKSCFNSYSSAFAVLDQIGQLRIFYMDKNRYITLNKLFDGQAISFIDVNGGQFAVSNNDKTIDIYSLQSQKLCHTLNGNRFQIKELRANYIRSFLAAISTDSIMIWDMINYFKKKQIFPKQKMIFTNAVFSDCGNNLFTIQNENLVSFQNLQNYNIDKEIVISQKVNLIATQSDYIAFAGNHEYIFIINLKSPENLKQYELPRGSLGVKTISFGPNFQLFLQTKDDHLYMIDVNQDMSVKLKYRLKSQGIHEISIDKESQKMILQTSQDIQLLNIKKIHSLSKSSSVLSLVQSNTQNQTLNLEETQKSTVRFNQDQSNVVNESDRTAKMNKSTSSKNTSFKDTMQTSMNGSKLDPISIENFKPEKLQKFLKRFSRFPDKHRILIWKHLLQLPLNQEHFDALQGKNTHSAYINLKQSYPISDKKLFFKLQKILSCLAHYCPLFAELSYLPSLIFPFIKLFHSDDLVCFEIVLSFLTQWSQHFFELYPGPPVKLIQFIFEIVKQNDQELYFHLKDLNCNLSDMVWPSLQGLCTDFLSRDEWLSMMDCLISRPQNPELLCYFLASYFLNFRGSILSMQNSQQISVFVSHQKGMVIEKIIDKSLHLMKIHDMNSCDIQFFCNIPLHNTQYQFFDSYPKFMIDHHMKMREQIQFEEEKLQQRQQTIVDLQRMTDDLMNEEQKLRERQQMLSKSEKERRELLKFEEQARLEKKLQFEADQRKKRVDQLLILEKTIKESLFNQENQQQEQLRNLEDDIHFRNKFEDMELQNRKQEEQLLNMEFYTTQKMNEIIEKRLQQEQMQKLQNDVEFRQQENIMKRKIYEERQRAEDAEIKLRKDILRQKILTETRLHEDLMHKEKLQKALLLKENEQELQQIALEKQRKLRLLMEEESLQNQEHHRSIQDKQKQILQDQEITLRKAMEYERNEAIKDQIQRIDQLQQLKRSQERELQMHRENLNDNGFQQRKDNFENYLFDVQSQTNQRLKQEENTLMEMYSELDNVSYNQSKFSNTQRNQIDDSNNSSYLNTDYETKKLSVQNQQKFNYQNNFKNPTIQDKLKSDLQERTEQIKQRLQREYIQRMQLQENQNQTNGSLDQFNNNYQQQKNDSCNYSDTLNQSDRVSKNYSKDGQKVFQRYQVPNQYEQNKMYQSEFSSLEFENTNQKPQRGNNDFYTDQKSSFIERSRLKDSLQFTQTQEDDDQHYMQSSTFKSVDFSNDQIQN